MYLRSLTNVPQLKCIDVTHLGSFNDDCASRGQQSPVVIEIKLAVFEPKSLLKCLY